MKKKSKNKDDIPFSSLMNKTIKMEKAVLGYVPEDADKVRDGIYHEIEMEGVYK